MSKSSRWWWVWLVAVGLNWSLAHQVMAETVTHQPGEIVFADDFSQGLGKWQVTRGAASIWQPVNGMVEATVLGTSTVSELVPKPEFWDAAWRNYEFEVDMFPLAGADRNLAWGYQSLTNWYEIHFLPSFFELARLRDGSVAWSQRQNFVLTNNQWHHLKLQTSGGQLKLWVDGALVYTTNEVNYTENPGSIALKVGTGATVPTTVRFDNVQVRLVADTRAVDLAVPAVRQDDPAWASLTYDKAESWVKPEEATTIQRWGCALTSAVMLLRFHGFGQLSDGQVITPASLNTWLLTQPDGYVADGWVNWLAVIRLARELREKFSTVAQPLPQLSYVYRSWQDWLEGQSILRAEIDQHKPTILELPKHFVVLKGYVENGTEWLVRDPASSAETLSQVNQPVVSARTFLATTDANLLDLSYWLLILPKGLRVRIFNAQGYPVTGWWISQDVPGGLANTADGTASMPSDWIAMTLPHPPSGQFILEIGRATGNEAEDGAKFPTANLPTLVPFKLGFFQYDAQARVTAWHQTGSLGSDFPRWNFNSGTTQSPPTLQTQFGWHDWRLSLRHIAAEQKLPRLAVARLDQVAELAEVTEQELIVATQPTDENKQLLQVQLNRRYALWLKNILSQVNQTWSVVQGIPELAHLQNQLGRWLDSVLSN